MNSATVDLRSVEALYSSSINTHGAVAKGLGWKSTNDHELRFAKLCALFDFSRPLSINDLGCGYGSLFDYLTALGAEITRFHGVDISESMIREAALRHPGSIFDFHIGHALLQDADYSIASGIFNVRNEHTDSQWCEHILETVSHLNLHSNRGFAFNALTSFVDWKEDHLYYADPLFFFNYCKRNCSPRVALFHDYQLWEWTIVVLKQ